MTGTAGGSDDAAKMQGQILRDDAERQTRSVHSDQHVLRRLLKKRLRREHVFHLGGTDAKGERAECTMRCGVRIAANERHSGQGESLLGPDDVHDPLPFVAKSEIAKSELVDIFFERLHL